MKKRRARRVEVIFHRASRLEGEARKRFLERACADDPALLRDVESLLALDVAEDERLDRPAHSVLSLEPGAGDRRDDRWANRWTGRRMGPYTLGRSLATGGMGAVYVATQEHPHRTVAVKVLRDDAATPDLARRFDIEASLLARLQHPAIAHVYGAGVAELDGSSVPWIAMEHIESARTITEWAQSEGLSLDARLELFARVTDAVHHGHQRGVLHRDIKPANVLVDAEGRPKLIDFGIARALDLEDATRRTEAGVLLGTVQYMSPEQCVDARDLDVRSDVYSLGALLYELVCGAPPHDLSGVPLPEAARIVRDESPRRPSTILRSVQGDLETILLTALAKEPERRYQSAAELSADVRRYVAREPIHARAPSLRYRATLFARRRKALVAAVVTVFVVALGAAAVSLRFALSERNAREREERSATLANVTAADLLLRSHDVQGARRHLERVPPERRGWEWRYLAGQLDHSSRAIVGPLARCESIAWQGERIASSWHYPMGHQVVLWDSRSGARVAGTNDLDVAATRVAFTGVGIVAWGGFDGSVRCWNPASGETRRLGAHAGYVSALATFGGSVFSGSTDGHVRRWHLDREGFESCFEGDVALCDLAVAPDGRLALGREDGSVAIVRSAASGYEKASLSVLRNNGSALAVAWSRPDVGPTTSSLAVGASDGTLVVVEPDSMRELLRSKAHTGPVQDLAFLPDGRLVSVSGDRTVRVWNVRAGVGSAVLNGHTAIAKCIAVAPDGARVASGGYDGTLRLWEPDRVARHRSWLHGDSPAREVSFAPDGRTVALAFLDGSASTIDAKTGAALHELCGHTDRLTAIDHHPSGHHVATASNDGTVRVWDVADGTSLATLDDFSMGVLSTEYVAGSERVLLASGDRGGRVTLHDAATFELVASARIGESFEHLAAAPNGRYLAVATGTPELALLTLPGLEEVWRRRVDAPMHDVVFAPDGRTLATGEGDYDGTGLRARLWNAESGDELRSFVGHGDVVIGVAFSPGGERLVTTSADGTVRLWDPRTADPLLSLPEHASWVWSADFSPDGRTLVTSAGSLDQPAVGVEVRFWRAGASRDDGDLIRTSR